MERKKNDNSKIKSLRLAVLGGFDVRAAEHPILETGYAKLRGLLIFLAMSNGMPVKREYLAYLFWSEMSAAASRQNLRRALFNLKTAMGTTGQLLAANREEVTLARPDSSKGIWLDAAEFAFATPSCMVTRPTLSHCTPCLAQMEYQTKLYRGEFMAGFSLPDCPAFEDWLQIKREKLHRHVLALLEKSSDCCEQANDYEKALLFALRHSELEPWDENAQRRVMRLYALNGQSSAAIAQYETCCRVLKKELGALPDNETRQLAERIRNGQLQRKPFDKLGTNGIHETIPQIHAERRQVTVLYCELHVATDDPDDAMEQLAAPQARCVELIRQFYGHIVQTHGGGLLAYFGYPRADEHAARHAVQAALAVTHDATPGIEIRAGVHTGLIITGGDMPDTSGMSSRIAIQLRLCVAPNEVAISRDTQQLVAGYFDYASLGEPALSGIARALEIFRVTQESGARTHLDAAAQLTPFAGRKAEIAQLLKLWQSSLRGKRHVALVQGEAGIGKSRLLHALKEHLAGQPHAIRELRCFPEFSQSPFHPLRTMLEAVFGFAHDDTSEEQSCKLKQYLETHYPATAHETAPLLAHLLALPLAGDRAEPELSPQQLKERTIAALLGLLHSLAMQQPVLMIVEDLHWVDPSTQELLTLFMGQKSKARVLALLTARPEFVPLWSDAFDATLTLAPLADEEAAQMVASIGGNMPSPLMRRIVERSDGVPLFVEEMTRFAVQDDRAGIPASLHDLLTARMDNLGEAKHVAQLAATIGREFDEYLLRRIYPGDPAALAQSLGALQDAWLIFEMDETTRQFKHALIQEAAYQSMTKANRQDAHRRVAQTLQNDFSDAVATQPEVIAQHFAAAGETRQAIEYWIKAGQRAALFSANQEAVGHFNSGLSLLPALSPNTERDRCEYELRVNLGTALIAANGYGSAEAARAYARAIELSEHADDRFDLFNALWGIWLTSGSRVGHLHSIEVAEKLLYLAGRGGDSLQLQLAHHALGNSLFMSGDQAAARAHLERAISLYHPSQHDIMVRQYGENICVSGTSILAFVLWLLGLPEQAIQTSLSSLAMARQLNHANSLAFALSNAALCSRMLKQVETSGQLSQELITLAQQQSLPFWLEIGVSFYGWVRVMQDQAAGVEQIQKFLDTNGGIMSGAKLFFLIPLCDALVHLGRCNDALARINEGLDIMNATDSHFFESEFLRLKGECLLGISASNAEEAEACFAQALAISRQQGAKSLELRAATSFAQHFSGSVLLSGMAPEPEKHR